MEPEEPSAALQEQRVESRFHSLALVVRRLVVLEGPSVVNLEPPVELGEPLVGREGRLVECKCRYQALEEDRGSRTRQGLAWEYRSMGWPLALEPRRR